MAAAAAAIAMLRELYEAIYAPDGLPRAAPTNFWGNMFGNRRPPAAALRLPPLHHRLDRLGDRTPLMLAVKAGRLELVAWLLRPEADAAPTPAPAPAAPEDTTAAEAEQEQAGPDAAPVPVAEQEQAAEPEGGGGVGQDAECLNAQDEEGATALHHACRGQHLDIIDLLLDASIDPYFSCEGGTPFLEAARAGHASMLARLVAGVARQLARGLHHEIVPEEDDEEAQGGMGNAGPGPVPLEEARPQAALLLAEERAHGGRTALWWATYMGHSECVALLLGYGCSPLEKDNRGTTPFSALVMGGVADYRHRAGARQLMLAAMGDLRRYRILEKARALADAHRAVRTTLEPPPPAPAAAATAVAALMALAGQAQGREQQDAAAAPTAQSPPGPIDSPTARHRRALALLRAMPPLDARFEQGGLEALPLVEMVPLPSVPPPVAPAAEEGEEGPTVAVMQQEQEPEQQAEQEGTPAAMELATATTTPAAAPAAPVLDETTAVGGEGAAPMSTEEEVELVFTSSPRATAAAATAAAAVQMDTREGEGGRSQSVLMSPIGWDVELFPVAAPTSLEEEEEEEGGFAEKGKEEAEGVVEAGVPMAVVGETPAEQDQRAASVSPVATSTGGGSEGEGAEEQEQEGGQGKGVKRPHAETAAQQQEEGVMQGLDAEGRVRLEAVARHVMLGGLEEEVFEELDVLFRFPWYR